MKQVLQLILLLALSTSVQGKNLGVHGRIYDIKENDLLTVLQDRAQAEVDSGKWDERVDQWKDQAKQQANRPNGITLPRAKETRSHLFDPSIIVPEDIRDAAGTLLHAQGTSVNPLSFISMSRHLIFIDGEDKQQLEWMMHITRNEVELFKVILTNGAVIDLMKSLNRRLYFDQKQHYVNKLAIKSLPALVYQEGQYLRIDEVAIP